MSNGNAKAKMKAKVLKAGKPVFLSAQEYGLLTSDEKTAIREALVEENQDADEYERNMKKLWPKKVVFHTKWRNK